MARKPQMDRQLPHAFINDGTTNTANAAQLAAMRPSGISEAQWEQMPLQFKRFLTRDSGGGIGSNSGNDNGMLTGAPAAPAAPTAPTAPTLGQLTTGGQYESTRPSWAPNWPTAAPQAPQQPSFAPQWQPQAPLPSFAPPQPRSMLGAPMQLQAPPSRFNR